jgi:hypothetical protein
MKGKDELGKLKAETKNRVILSPFQLSALMDRHAHASFFGSRLELNSAPRRIIDATQSCCAFPDAENQKKAATCQAAIPSADTVCAS